MSSEPLSPRPEFDHRRKSDQTFDSICLYCCRTIATSASESTLDATEQSHCCYQRQQRLFRRRVGGAAPVRDEQGAADQA